MKDDLIKFLAVILLILALVSFFMLVDYVNTVDGDYNGGKITLEVKEEPENQGNISLGVKEAPENQTNIETGEVSNNTEDKNE